MQAILTQTSEIPEEERTTVRLAFLFALAVAVCGFVLSDAAKLGGIVEPASMGAHAPTVDQFLAERAALEERVHRKLQASHRVTGDGTS